VMSRRRRLLLMCPIPCWACIRKVLLASIESICHSPRMCT
jgi:hypothetical protein